MNSNKYNVYEVYLYKYKKFILTLTYTPGFNIQNIVNDIVKTFNLFPIFLGGSEMLNSDSVFDYLTLNNKVKQLLNESNFKIKTSMIGHYGQGILIYGLSFPTKKLDFQIDLHLHISTSINMFLKSNLSTNINKKIKYTIDDYNKLKDTLIDNKINKYFNIKADQLTNINDDIYDKIIDFLELNIYEKNYKKLSTNSQKKLAKSNILPPISSKKNILDISKNNEELKNKIDDVRIDIALSISSDNIDDDIDDNSTNYKKYKKLAKSTKLSESELKLSDSELLSEHIIDTYTDLVSDSDTKLLDTEILSELLDTKLNTEKNIENTKDTLEDTEKNTKNTEKNTKNTEKTKETDTEDTEDTEETEDTDDTEDTEVNTEDTEEDKENTENTEENTENTDDTEDSE